MTRHVQSGAHCEAQGILRLASKTYYILGAENAGSNDLNLGNLFIILWLVLLFDGSYIDAASGFTLPTLL